MNNRKRIEEWSVDNRNPINILIQMRIISTNFQHTCNLEFISKLFKYSLQIYPLRLSSLNSMKRTSKLIEENLWSLIIEIQYGKLNLLLSNRVAQIYIKGNEKSIVFVTFYWFNIFRLTGAFVCRIFCYKNEYYFHKR